MPAHLDAILASADRLPPFPRVAQQALALLEDPDVAVARLVDVLELDPHLTARVLRAANSAQLSRGLRVDNLRQAVARLGLGPFRELVLSSASAPLLAGPLHGYGLAAGDLWHHSVATALLAQILAERLGHRPSPALYTGALLHDLGKTVLAGFLAGDGGAQALAAALAGGAPALETERGLCGIDHAELGARIGERWRFSPELAELIRFHHAPDERPAVLEVGLLALANQLCQLLGLGGGVDGLAERPHDRLIERLRLRRADLEAALVELQGRLERATGLLALAGDAPGG